MNFVTPRATRFPWRWFRPGDLIVWVHNGYYVSRDECLWSSTMQQYVPIGNMVLLISIVDLTMTWFSHEGMFHAAVNDTIARNNQGTRFGVRVEHISCVV
jgi:hypothetical protein